MCADKSIQKFLANSVLNQKESALDSSYSKHDLISNIRIGNPINFKDQHSSKDLDGNSIISMKDVFLWEIDNTITLLEKELNRLEWLNDPNQQWFCDMILKNIKFLEQKYEVVKEATEKEVEEDWSDYDLEKELRFILQKCILRK